MADALRPLPALDGQTGSAGLVAVHAAGWRQSVRREREGQRQGQVTGEEEGTWWSGEREGESPRWGPGLRERNRVR